jgi:hypothetical protein
VTPNFCTTTSNVPPSCNTTASSVVLGSDWGLLHATSSKLRTYGPWMLHPRRSASPSLSTWHLEERTTCLRLPRTLQSFAYHSHKRDLYATPPLQVSSARFGFEISIFLHSLPPCLYTSARSTPTSHTSTEPPTALPTSMSIQRILWSSHAVRNQ